MSMNLGKVDLLPPTNHGVRTQLSSVMTLGSDDYASELDIRFGSQPPS